VHEGRKDQPPRQLQRMRRWQLENLATSRCTRTGVEVFVWWRNRQGGLPESAGRLGRFLLGRSCSWGACSNDAGAPSRYREVDGSPRVHAELVLGDQERIGRNRGRRLMRQVVAGEKPHVHRRAGTTAVGRAARCRGRRPARRTARPVAGSREDESERGRRRYGGPDERHDCLLEAADSDARYRRGYRSHGSCTVLTPHLNQHVMPHRKTSAARAIRSSGRPADEWSSPLPGRTRRRRETRAHRSEGLHRRLGRQL